jgi:hypothetical protein
MKLFTTDLLPLILKANEQLHQETSAHLKDVDCKKYVRDFRTIRFDFGQRSGKSYAITQLAFDSDVVLCPGVDDIRRWYPGTKATVLSYSNFLNADDPNEDFFLPERISRFWLDYASSTPKAYVKILEHLITSPEQQIILLG